MKTKPKWLIEFRNKTKELIRKSNGHEYLSGQKSLKTLLRTGAGNCIAWSLLFKEIAEKFGLTIYLIALRMDGSGWFRHQVSIVIGDNGDVYLQSCTSVTKQRIKLSESMDKKQLIHALTKCARRCSKRYKKARIDWLVKFKLGQKTTILNCEVSSSWRDY